MLAHLVIPAVYDHRLDCGPQLLPDIAYLFAAAPIDWQPFWAQAEAQGWREGAALVLELARAHDPAAPVSIPPAAAAPVIDAAADILLENLFTRVSAGVVATMAARGPPHFSAASPPAAVAATTFQKSSRATSAATAASRIGR